MRFGVLILPDVGWRVAHERWRSAERMGFDHAWTYDHLTWRPLRDRPWFGAVPTLAAAAVVTSRIRLGTMVASPNFRHPVALAKEIMTLDDLSDGRMTLGIGAGGSSDATATRRVPWSVRERAERCEEFVALLDRLLVMPATTYEGQYYVANEARSIPGCRQQPRVPFAIAATDSRSLRVAARYGRSWIASDSRGAGAELVRRLEDACRAETRDPASIGRIALVGHRERPLASVEAFRDVAGRYAESGFTDLVVHWPRSDEPFTGDIAVLERVAAEVLPGGRL